MNLEFGKYSVTVIDGDNTFSYTLLDGKIIVRQEAVVNGYTFSKDYYSPTRYWKKCGRGGVKQRKEVEQQLIKADSFLYNQGYSFR